MTEIQWLEWPHPRILLRYLRRDADWTMWLSDPESIPRKWRLFACACCRRIWHLLNKHEREMVEISERLADSELKRWRTRYQRLACKVHDYHVGNAASMTLACPAAAASVAGHARIAAARKLAAPFSPPQKLEARKEGLRQESKAQAELVRDIFGNPFRLAEVADSWFTATVRKLAETIYEHRSFERLSELADQLSQEGCSSEDILAHCRNSEADHVRGCWIVDLILAKQ